MVEEREVDRGAPGRSDVDVRRDRAPSAGRPEGEEAEREKLPIYEYQYKNDPAALRHVGPMAQDVKKVDPKAVKNVGNRMAIDTRRVMGNILKAA